MRRYISQEDMKAALKKLNSQMDQELHREEIERIKGTDTPLGYRTTPQRHVLWSDGTDTATFRNTHRCWPLPRSE